MAGSETFPQHFLARLMYAFVSTLRQAKKHWDERFSRLRAVPCFVMFS